MLMCRVNATADFFKERHSDSGWIGTNYRTRAQILSALLFFFLIELANALKRGLSFLFVFVDKCICCSGPIFSTVDGRL